MSGSQFIVQTIIFLLISTTASGQGHEKSSSAFPHTYTSFAPNISFKHKRFGVHEKWQSLRETAGAAVETN